MKYTIKAFSLVVIIGMTITLLIWTRPDTQAELQPLPPTRVATDLVRIMDIQPTARITGKLQPARKAALRFEVSGNVTQRFVEPGQLVSAGETLLQIDDGDFIDTVEEADALLAQEKNAITRDRHLLELLVKEREVIQRELNRLERLGQESLASKSKYDEALQRLLQRQADETRLRHSVESSTSRIKIRAASLNRARRNLDRTRLVAPFTGTINSVSVEVGDFATAGQVAIDLVQLDTVDLYLEVTGAVIKQLSLGQKVNVFIDNRSLSGEIISLAADPDPVTHTHALKIHLPADGLYPGQLAIAELPGKLLSDVNVVPVSSILREEGQSFVFKIEKNHAMRHPVDLIQRHQDWQVVSGILPGVKIISRDVATLANGQEVQTE